MWGAAVRTWSAVVKSVHVCLVVWLGKEVYCSSSRAFCAQRAGAAHRSRTTRSWHQLPGNGSSVVYVREEQYVEVAPHAAGRSWALGLDSD